jgi:hypothetical protein
MDTKIGLDLFNEIFMLQMMGQDSKPPDLYQKEAYDKVQNWYESEYRRAIHTGRLRPFSLSLFKAKKSLSRPVGEREIGRFEIGVSAGPVLPSIYREVDGRELYETENVAVRLVSLRSISIMVLGAIGPILAGDRQRYSGSRRAMGWRGRAERRWLDESRVVGQGGDVYYARGKV